MHEQRKKSSIVFGGKSSNFDAILLLHIGDTAAFCGDHVASLWLVSLAFQDKTIGLQEGEASVLLLLA